MIQVYRQIVLVGYRASVQLSIIDCLFSMAILVSPVHTSFTSNEFLSICSQDLDHFGSPESITSPYVTALFDGYFAYRLHWTSVLAVVFFQDVV